MRRLCLFTGGFALAAAGYVLALLPAAWYVLAPAAALCALLFLLHRPLARRFAVCALGFCVGLGWSIGYEALFLRPLAGLNGQTRDISAQVRALPQRTAYGYGVEVRLHLDGRVCAAVVYYDEADGAPQPGDIVSCRAALTVSQARAATGSSYEISRGLRLTAAAREPLRVTPGPADASVLPGKLAVRLREALAQSFAPDTAGFLQALLLGDRSGLSYQTRNEMAIAGVYHAVAVSGMHVSILLGMILLLCGGNHRLAAALGIPAIVFFIAMTGAPASAVRAGIMQTMVLLAPLLRRENDPPTTVSAALLCLLAQNPWAILDVGLQLSVASTAGIVLFAGGVFRRLHGQKTLHRLLRRHTAFSWVLRAMTTALSCTAASMVFALPVTCLHFGMVSLAAPVTNVLCLWLLSVVFCGGMAAALLTLVYAPVGAALGWLLGWPVRLVLLIVRLVSSVPFAAVYLENAYLIAAAVFLYVLALTLTLFPKKLRILPALGLWLAVTAVCFGLSYLDYRLPAASFTVLDVGQGQCLISRVGGDITLIDCGGRADESGEKAARYLLAHGVTAVERLVLTHFDADHCNGVRQLLRRVCVGTLYVPDTQEGAALRAQLLLAAMDSGTQICTVTEDLTLPVPGGSVTIFAPVSGKADENDGLCVLAACEKYDILVTGDLDEQAEYRLLSAHTLPRVTALVAGHHGAKTSTSDALLEAVQPQAVLISVGADNRFGHPGLQTLTRIASSGAAVYRTDLQGTITIRGGKHMAKKQDGAPEEALRRFKQDLKAGTLANFYIVSGEEAFLRDHYLRLLTQKLTDGPAGEFNFHRFTAADCTPQSLSDAIDAMPMMAERTLVRVDDVDLFKQPESARAQYAAILGDIPDYCCVVFAYDTVPFKINAAMKTLASVVREKAQILTFDKQSERDLCAWIARHFRAHGKSVSDQLCQYLIFRTDGLMTTLSGEIEKIAAYNEGPEISRGAIDAVVIPALSAQTFDISDAIVQADFETALSKLQELYALQTDPIAILGAIGAQLRRLFYARVILSAGGGQKELMDLTGLKSYPAGLTMTAARRVTDGFCQTAVELCLQTDVAMKSSADAPERLLELLVAQLAAEARRG